MISLKNSHIFKGLVLLILLFFLVSGVAAESADEQSLADIEALIDSGDYDDAIYEINNLLIEYHDDAELWVLLGRSLKNSYKFEEALSASEKAIELDLNSANAWNVKSAALVNLGRNEEALSASEKAIELDPDYALAWNNKGAVLVNLGRNEEALSALEKAIELDFNSANAWNIKGNALYGLDRYEEAISAYNKAIEIDPEFAFAWYNKGNVLYILYLNEEALLAYNKAIELDPEDAFAWNNKGIILSKLDRFEEAINAYDKAIEINPEHKSAWNGKEKALRQLGRSSEATDASLRLIYLDLKGYFKDYFLEIEVIMFLIISFILSRNFWKYIIKRKQKKNEQKQALKTERDRIIKKINSFLQPGEQIEDNNPKKEDINQPIWEKHAWEYEDLDPEVSRQIKDISQPDSFELDFNQKIPEKSTNSPEGSKYTGICPVCGSPLVWRRAKKTGELYRGCTNYNGGCRYNDRSH